MHETPSNHANEAPKQQGFLGNLAFNIVLPVVIMSYTSSEEYLGPMWSIVVALGFPLSYGLYDLQQTKKVNGFYILTALMASF